MGLVLGCEAFRSCLRAAHSRGSHAATFLARPHCRPLARLEGRGPRFLKRRRASYQKFSGRKMRSWREPKIKNLSVLAILGGRDGGGGELLEEEQ